MSDADRVRVSLLEETTFGVTPSGSLSVQRITGESLQGIADSTKSAEIRGDRQVADVIRTAVRAGGDLNFELSYGSQDLLMEAALLSADWSSEVDLSCANTTIAASTGTLTDAGSGASFANAVAGQWILISGATLSANNGLFKILSKTDSNNIVIAGAAALADDTTENLVIKMGAQIVNGTEQRSFSIEREYQDLTNKFAAFVGMMADGLNLTIPNNGVITGSIPMLGKEETSESATIGTGYTAANSNPVMNGIDHPQFIIDGVPVVNQANAFQAIETSVALANALRTRNVIGTLGPVSVGSGKIGLTGILRAYYASETLVDKFLNWTESAIAWGLKDGSASPNYYVVELPAIRYTDAKRVAGGESSDVIMDMTFEAKRHGTEDAMIRVVRWPGS